ncbi:hypothetical protein OPV22_026087 [Ensete ventricosum]|uniref:Uncharacterized protein n=1 Tax=Ensete ventricosum TaxID=4639 RepID=A0AAV8QEU6_ENSVE|nr:hypothetical protein OPV22_026087 [Ensete ventricosum]
MGPAHLPLPTKLYGATETLEAAASLQRQAFACMRRPNFQSGGSFLGRERERERQREGFLEVVAVRCCWQRLAGFVGGLVAGGIPISLSFRSPSPF